MGPAAIKQRRRWGQKIRSSRYGAAHRSVLLAGSREGAEDGGGESEGHDMRYDLHRSAKKNGLG